LKFHRVVILAFLFGVVSPYLCLSQKSPPKTSGGFTSVEEAELGLAREKLEFDRFNENRKARYELYKTGATALALVIPLLVAAYTVSRQVRSSERLKAVEAKYLFELKAAEIVMSAKNPIGVRNKARVLQALFPDRLGAEFARSFEPEAFSFPGPGQDFKVELFRLMIQYPDREQEITDLWFRMFPGDLREILFPKQGDIADSANPDASSGRLTPRA
jgi:hypothetical protein